LQRTVYLEMTEGNFKLPGWMLSTGTIRVLAIIALLRHPEPPPLIFIEELENGLDPRTLNLVVEEIRRSVQLERTQVIITTHSPYLLDLLSLSQIVVVERVNGQPVFTRPADHPSLEAWLEKFSPGQLYTMGRLRGGQS
jgi:predicted ATPase